MPKNKHIWKGAVSHSETWQQMQWEKWPSARLHGASARFGSDEGQWQVFIEGCAELVGEAK